ncbi:hypothetical protein CEE37_02360 [candidate division LCP-89 bacterium B3_LCP]|uniref:Uncharacterized protein n=1 Tax=candidate division LCP-89 bacterium B3_LCP TaxID=2012998 RepID=A0A532V5Z4_UNCL8|nr:MAG: hypothetical protein CEE37_02360 [candidate division LCP-89 bacterium B3_LCP]
MCVIINSSRVTRIAILLTLLILVPMSIVIAETLVLQPGAEGKDSYTCNCAPNTNNPFGPITKLYQGQIGVCINTALSQWDISTIPANVIITDATVEFHCFQMEGTLTGEMLYSRILEDWGETLVTHNTLPRYTEDGQIVTGWPVGGQWHVVDVTEFVQGWYSGAYPNFGIIMHSRNTSGTCDANWYSSDYTIPAYRPQMTITYQTLSPIEVTLTPDNPPIQIPANGGSFDFNIAVENSSPEIVTFDIWTMVTLPNGSEYGPIINVSVSMGPNSSIDRDRSQVVPANAPAGDYTYDAYVGNYPNTVWTEDHFAFSKSTLADGNGSVTGWNCTGESLTKIFGNDKTTICEGFTLQRVHPNPFNPTTVISFSLPVASMVKLEVFDISGSRVGVDLASTRHYPPGTHQITFDGSGLASGIYLYRLEAGEFTANGKMVLMK